MNINIYSNCIILESGNMLSELLFRAYHELHDIEDNRESKSEEVYDSVQPKCFNGNDSKFKSDTSLYNHLDEKPFQSLDDVYNKP